jgi:hypothetical protein
MPVTKSPFYVIQGLVPEQRCLEIAKELRVEPTLDQEGNPTAMGRHSTSVGLELFELLKPELPGIADHYGIKYRGTEEFQFQQFPVTNGQPAEAPHCENAVYKRKRWIRINDRDLTGIIWLKDYADAPPFNVNKHVYGGKLEFPVYNFGFQPQIGTCVIFPSSERFISLTSSIQVGELQVAKFHIAGEGVWIYNPDDYPGDFRDWFQDVV